MRRLADSALGKAMPRKRKRGPLGGGGIAFAIATLVLPISLARLLIGASWPQIGIAYLVWLAGIFILIGGLGKRTRKNEALGFTMIFAMFTLWAGVPLAALALRLLGLP
ncbi:hypothetical protein K3172_06005 [Qipengyuania sp. 6B39]|uniref:hypothetical protein n=1 Tax=Qipengyuania proteolytica TaxID=2867239 RepID=UPI001C89B0E0|nr:hypothetical protein [Qipengyuania proteolytica]MBX7495407.1 hypothetical protein [Qipengyuania proteolytica]